MLKAFVRRARIHEIRESELVDVSQSLEWLRIDDAALIGSQRNEGMYWITKLMVVFHDRARPGANRWTLE